MLADKPYPRQAEARRRTITQDEEYVRSHIWALEDRAVQDLFSLMLRARGNMTQALIDVAMRYGRGDTWNATDAHFRERTDELLRQIDAELNTLVDGSIDRTLADSIRAYQGGYHGRAWATEQAGRGAIRTSYARLPVEAIRAQILAPYRGLTFLDRFADARDDFTRRIRRSMVQSQIGGESIAQATRRLAKELGLDISRRGQDRGLFARLEMISRTEILRASNTAAHAIYEQNKDVLEGYRIIVTHDERTCPICAPKDNEFHTFKEGEEEMPPFHPNCRCSIVPELQEDALQSAIVAPREDYEDWARRNSIGPFEDGGLFDTRGSRPPRSPSDAAKKAAAGLFA